MRPLLSVTEKSFFPYVIPVLSSRLKTVDEKREHAQFFSFLLDGKNMFNWLQKELMSYDTRTTGKPWKEENLF